MVNSLAIDPTAALDLTDNDLVVQYGTGASPFTTIQGYAISGYSGSPDPSRSIT